MTLDQIPPPADKRLAVRVTRDALRQLRGGSPWLYDGSITALDFQSFVDGGGYGSYGVASTYYTGALQTVTYKIPTYRFRGVRVFTNKPACGPKRGHGTPQPRFEPRPVQRGGWVAVQHPGDDPGSRVDRAQPQRIACLVRQHRDSAGCQRPGPPVRHEIVGIDPGKAVPQRPRVRLGFQADHGAVFWG